MLFESEAPFVRDNAANANAALPSRIQLLLSGPLLRVVVSPTQQHFEILKENDQPPPDLISGFALVDTGCTFTAVDESVCAALGLDATGFLDVAHVDGSSRRPTFSVELLFPDLQTKPFTLAKAASVRLRSGNQRAIVLLGRDFLADVKLTYNGKRGRIEIDT